MLPRLACNAQQNGLGTLCNVTLTAPRRMAAPVFVYYELDNFYQNHRRCVQHSPGAASKVCGPERCSQEDSFGGVSYNSPNLQVPEQQERYPAQGCQYKCIIPAHLMRP